MLSVPFFYRYAECFYAEYRYAECRYAEWRGVEFRLDSKEAFTRQISDAIFKPR